LLLLFCFFFQADDGIRDRDVTGVQTCALPIFKDCTPVKGTFKGATRQHLFVYVSVGYEDGHIFEETTEVRLDHVDAPTVTEAELLAAMAAQQ